MALNIKDPEADRLAREVADLTGESITRSVVVALREKLAREKRRGQDVGLLVDEAMAIGRSVKALPTLDRRSEEAILGFDDMIR